MAELRVLATTAGPVEIAQIPGPGPSVLFFPGGHCPADVDCGWDFYTSNGYGVVAFSRPGYGSTDVGRLSAAGFLPAVREVCTQLGLSEIAAVVGVSFGGLQAVHAAADSQLRARRLILHSCAPSELAYPDSRAQAILGPVVFSAALQGLVWAIVRRSARSDAGLRRVMAPLSRLPAEQWWGELSDSDKARAREMFLSMRSGSGFANDLRQATPRRSTERARAISRVACPTLITGSPYDGGVSFDHAENFALGIARSKLLKVPSPTHLFWIGREAATVAAAVMEFMAT